MKRRKSFRRGSVLSFCGPKITKTQQEDIQFVVANRNLERYFFQKVNAFSPKVNAFFQKDNAFFKKSTPFLAGRCF
jgi:hypothetical protein